MLACLAQGLSHRHQFSLLVLLLAPLIVPSHLRTAASETRQLHTTSHLHQLSRFGLRILNLAKPSGILSHHRPVKRRTASIALCK